jgi:hypothetical protein
VSRTAVLSLVLLTVLHVNQPIVSAADKVIGAVWELWVKNPANDQWITRGKFRCTTDGKVYFDGKVVGTHKSEGDKVELVVTVAKDDANKGTFKGVKVAKDSSIWEGTFTKKDGSEVPIRLKLIAD